MRCIKDAGEFLMSAGYGNNRRGGHNSRRDNKPDDSEEVNEQSYGTFQEQLAFINNLYHVGQKQDVTITRDLGLKLFEHFDQFDLRRYVRDVDMNNAAVKQYFNCMDGTRIEIVRLLHFYVRDGECELSRFMKACGSWLMGSFVIRVKAHHMIMTSRDHRFQNYFYLPAGCVPMDFFNTNILRTRLIQNQPVRRTTADKDKIIHQNHLRCMVDLFALLQGLVPDYNTETIKKDPILTMIYQYMEKFKITLQHSISKYEIKKGKQDKQDAFWNSVDDSSHANNPQPQVKDDDVDNWEQLADDSATNNQVPAKKDSDTPEQGDDSDNNDLDWEAKVKEDPVVTTPDEPRTHGADTHQPESHPDPENPVRPNKWNRRPHIVPDDQVPPRNTPNEPRTHGAGKHQPKPQRTRKDRIKIPKIYAHKTFNPEYEYVPDNEATLKDWKGNKLETYDPQLPRKIDDNGVDWERIRPDQLIIMLRRMIAMYCHDRKKEKYRSFSEQKKIDKLTRIWEKVKRDLKSHGRNDIVQAAVALSNERTK
jgi:hypothetical protein